MNLTKEPLLHFLLIGVALFLLYGWRSNSPSWPSGQAEPPTAQIIVPRDSIDRMNDRFASTWQRPPTEEEQKELIEDFIRNEIYYREAVAAGLDRDDEVLRRRLRLKMEFIYEDIASLAEPANEDLQAFMERYREKYLADPQLSFRQVYINTGKRGQRAESDARKVLAQLTEGADPDAAGDPTLLEPEIPLSAMRDIGKQFGEAFGQSLLEIEPGRWAGPIQSVYGLHVVLVREHVGGRMPDLNEIREMVKRDWTAAKQKALKDAAYAKIRERYTVTVEQPKAAAAPLGDSTKTEVST